MITKTKLKALVGLMFFIIIAASIAIAQAVPEGPSTLTKDESTRRVAYPAPTLTAYAGNVSHLTVFGQTVTQTWQGYVGNVTGSITLDDGDNFTLYNWTLSDPEGEIYATHLSTVTWTTGNILCWNWSSSTGSYLSLYEMEHGATSPAYFGLGLESTDVDGVDETFTYNGSGVLGGGSHDNFYVAGQLIQGNVTRSAGGSGGGPCPHVNLFNSSGGGLFQEVILYDTANTGPIYASILRSNADGYDGTEWDFEMIVGENGHDGNTSTTTYYFYVELE